MGLLAWNDWHRSDDCKKFTDGTSFAGVSLTTILFAGMRKYFLDEHGNRGLIYTGQVMRAARIIRAANNWNRSGYEESDMRQMLQYGNYSFGSILESQTLKIDIDTSPASYGEANDFAFVGNSNTLSINFGLLVGLANRAFPQTAEGVGLFTDLMMGEVMHELMHTQGFKHKPDTGPADESFGSVYFASLPHLAKLSALGAGGRWDFFWNFWGKYAGLAYYPQLLGLHSFDTVSGPSWHGYEKVDGKVASQDLGVVEAATGLVHVYASEYQPPLRVAGPRRLAERSWYGGGWLPPSGWIYRELPNGMSLDLGVTAVSMSGSQTSIFATIGGKVMQTQSTDGSFWSPWSDCLCPGVAGGVSAIAIPGANRIDLYVRGTDSKLWQGDFQGLDKPFHWHALDSMTITSEPAAIALTADSRHVFAMDEHGAIGYKAWSAQAGWMPWVSIGGSCIGKVGAVALADTCSIDLYCRGLDSLLWQCWWNGDAWSGWVPHNDGQVMASAPTVASPSQDERSVYFVSPDHTVLRKRWMRDVIGN